MLNYNLHWKDESLKRGDGRATYARISTKKQNLASQKENIYGKLYAEAISGELSMFDRPVGKTLMEDIERGYIREVFVLDWDRLGRRAIHIYTFCDFLANHGCQLTVLSDCSVMFNEQTRKVSFSFSMLKAVKAETAEEEFNKYKIKTERGRKLASLQGKYKGSEKESKDTFLAKHSEAVKRIKGGATLYQLYTDTDEGKAIVSKNTAVKIKKMLSTS